LRTVRPRPDGSVLPPAFSTSPTTPSAVLAGLRDTHALTHVIGQLDNFQQDAVVPECGCRPRTPAQMHDGLFIADHQIEMGRPADNPRRECQFQGVRQQLVLLRWLSPTLMRSRFAEDIHAWGRAVHSQPSAFGKRNALGPKVYAKALRQRPQHERFSFLLLPAVARWEVQRLSQLQSPSAHNAARSVIEPSSAGSLLLTICASP
jgi:hypothetical protein